MSKTIQTVLTVQVFRHPDITFPRTLDIFTDHTSTTFRSAEVLNVAKEPGTGRSISHSTLYFPSAAQAHKARGLARGVRLRKGFIML